MEVGRALRCAAALLFALAGALVGSPRAEACEAQAPCGMAGIGALSSLGLANASEPPLVLATDSAKRAPIVIVPAKAPARTDGVEMPWIWKALKKSAYDHLPQKRFDGGVHCTFAPTIVSSGFDTVAGAGVEGRF